MKPKEKSSPELMKAFTTLLKGTRVMYEAHQADDSDTRLHEAERRVIEAAKVFRRGKVGNLEVFAAVDALEEAERG